MVKFCAYPSEPETSLGKAERTFYRYAVSVIDILQFPVNLLILRRPASAGPDRRMPRSLQKLRLLRFR